MRRTKIQATLGPASCSVETLRRMVEAGMDGCRLNMSHGSHRQAGEILEAVRRVSAEAGRPIPVGADLRGPKLRIGEVEGERILLEEGALVELTAEDRPTSSRVLSIDYPYLAEDVRPGAPVLLADGALVLRVEEAREGRVRCRVVKGGALTSRKGVNLPGVPLRVPSFTEKDLEDMAFAVRAGVDFLYLSYVRSREHVLAARAAVARLGRDLPLVAKIECQEGVEALAEIVEAADGICVARGDLGIEIPLGDVPALQEEAARLCAAAGKFVMVGGQVLASMVAAPIPLRAEVTDLATVVRQDLDAIVLSDETAAGDYPVEAVRIAAEVFSRCERARSGIECQGNTTGARSAIGPPAVVVVTRDGRAAGALAASRAFYPVVAAVDSLRVANWLATCWGTLPILLDDLSDPSAAAHLALSRARSLGAIAPSQRVLTLNEC